MKTTINIIGLILLFLLPKSYAQVTAVKYQMRYNTTTCKYDFYVIVAAGSTPAPLNVNTNFLQRVQGNSQVSFVVPTGTSVSFPSVLNDAFHYPFASNQSGTSTTPMKWQISTTVAAPAITPTLDYISITPVLSPSAHWNQQNTGDTIRIFSLDISPIPPCFNGIRLFDNGIDPNSSANGFEGADFSQGFSVGGATQDYVGPNLPSNPPPKPILSTATVCTPGLNIDLSATTSTCQTPLTYSWTGPNGYTGITQDVSIPNATAANTGTYTVTVTDKLQCTSTKTIIAALPPSAGPDVQLCSPGTVNLTGTSPTTGTWSAAPANPSGAIMGTPTNGVMSVDFTNATPGSYTFSYTANNCTDDVLVSFGGADAGVDPPVVGCFLSGSASITALGTGTWKVSSTSAGTAVIASSTSASTTVSGFTNTGNYYLVWTSNGCKDSVLVATNNLCGSCNIGNNNITQPLTASFCNVSTAVLISGTPASPVTGIYTWQVSTNSGATYTTAPGTSNAKDFTTPALGPGIYFYRRLFTTTSAPFCIDTSNTIVQLLVSDNTTAVGLGASTTALCLGSPSNLTATNVPGATYVWSASSSAAGLLSSTTNATSMNPTTTGTYTVTVTRSISTCTSTANVTIVASAAPPAPTSIAATTTSVCIGTTTVVSVTNVPGTTYNWTSSNPAILKLLSPSTSNAATFSGVAPGTATVSVTATTNGCTSPAATIIITVGTSPPTPTQASVTVTNPTTCGGTDGAINLSGLTSNATYTVNYLKNLLPGSASVIASGTGVITVTGLSSGSYTNISVTNSSGCSSGVYPGPISLNDPGNTTPSNLIASPNPICIGSDVNLSVTNINGATFNWTVSSTSANVSSSTSNTSVFNSAIPGLYTVSVTQTVAGCVSPPASLNILVTNDCYDPDFGVTFVNKPLTGDLSTNDFQDPRMVYNAPIVNGTNPSSCAPIVAANGIYSFICATKGEYNYFVPVTIGSNTVNVPLTISVLEEESQTNPPIAQHDYATTKTNISIPINILANDRCESASNCTLNTPTMVISPLHGTYNFSTNIYTPTTGFMGKDSFRYEVCQTPATPSTTSCDQEWVFIDINPTASSNFTNAMDDYGQTQLNTTLTVNGANGLKKNDTDVEGNATTVSTQSRTIAGKGSITIASDGSYVFTPANGYIGQVDFPYAICDNGNPSACDSATLHLLVESFKCSKVGNLVWYDTNKNDIWDAEENGINGLQVNLRRADKSLVETQITGHKPNTPSDDGWYEFCAPPGRYYIEFILPPNNKLVPARPFIGGNSTKDSDVNGSNGPGTTPTFTVIGGQDKLDIGAGFYPMAIAGNLVWVDENYNGFQDSDEPKLSGVIVQAVDATSNLVVGEAVTDNGGVYEIDYLQKAEIFYRFIPPSGWNATYPNPDAVDDMNSDVDHSNGYNTTRTFRMLPGVTNPNIDMGVAFGALPVKWEDVNVQKVTKGHKVNWTTSIEVNLDHYEVERLLEGETDFVIISEKVRPIKANVIKKQYDFTDNKTQNGWHHYRIKQVDFDGSITYSKEVSILVNNASSKDDLLIYPNPTSNKSVLRLNLENDGEIVIKVTNILGETVKYLSNKSFMGRGQHDIELDLRQLTAGVYNINVEMEGKVMSQKVVKE
jgi:hypothetical protein